MSSVAWYWHRLSAMSPAELAAHGRRKVYQISDSLLSSRRFASVAELPRGSCFPLLPPAEAAPEVLKAALRRDAADILAGRWIAFGCVPLQVDTPPRWHKDYLAGVELATDKPALKLHHRLQGSADIKLIWEPSRWYSLLRLAQAGYVLHDPLATQTCAAWMEHWVQKNPPYYGWNWISALESGLRLIQFAWMDALVPAQLEKSWARLRAAVLPAHCWYTWRDRSFGSSANNHLIGELAGLIVTLVRWPALACWAAPLEEIHRLWEGEVLKQFAPDGGNREQALNYQLFSWEFCWQARLALRAAGRPISDKVEDRLASAANFFRAAQVGAAQWDYGDSDSAYVTPLFADWDKATTEWHAWIEDPSLSPSIAYWLADRPQLARPQSVLDVAKQWQVFPDSGYAVCRTGPWFLRWDLSPLGYLATAGHGHCDALHLSIWYEGEPIVIDPGTGAYHADRAFRDYLASWEAHNGPHPIPASFPERKGTFLWAEHHQKPRWQQSAEDTLRGELTLPTGVMRRSILATGSGWHIEDGFYPGQSWGPGECQVLWQFAPGAELREVGPGQFRIEIRRAAVTIELDPGWRVIHPESAAGAGDASAQYGLCSPAFRRTEQAPYLALRGTASAPRGLRTLFQGG